MVKLVVGLMGSSAAHGSPHLATTSQLSDFLSLCTKHGVDELDTARAYKGGQSEELLGTLSDEQKKLFKIATKAPAFSPGSLSHREIIDNCNKSLAALKVDKVPLYYLHGPDSATPLEEQCRAITQLYKEGKFTHFGVSNLSPSAVTEICKLCASLGGPRPTVYQGGYNALHRGMEPELLPLLRKHGIAYYAWGPLAGGALAKSLEELQNPQKGSRFEAMPVFGHLFLKEQMVTALKKLTATCEQAGVSLHEASLRWIMYSSALGEQDAVIVGASTKEQLEASLKAVEKGKLSEELQEAFEQLWRDVKDVANPYSY